MTDYCPVILKRILSVSASGLVALSIFFWSSSSQALGAEAACTSANTNSSVTCTGLTSVPAAGVITNTSPGVITVPNGADGIYSALPNETITNTGTVTSTNIGNYGVRIGADGAVFNNSGLVSLNAAGGYTAVVVNGGVANTMINNNLGGSIIQSGDGGYGIGSFTDGVTTINNAGSVSVSGNSSTAILFQSPGTVNNTGSIISSGDYGYGITLVGNLGVVNNNLSGTIRATGIGGIAIYNGGTNSIINNAASGTITGGAGAGIFNDGGTITSITNRGTITAGAGGYGIIDFFGTITTLNNAQGAGNAAGSLTYVGTLPTNYNIIINGVNSFGKLAIIDVIGSTSFGIYTGSTVANGKYAAVLTGLSADNLTSTTGTFGMGRWTLSEELGSYEVWDLIMTGYGPSTANTQQSLVNTANALAPIYSLQNAVVINSFTYDCSLFDVNNICISAGGRNTAVSAANGLNNTSALLIAAYRPHPNYRVGAYADQNLSVSNAGSTVNLSNNTPLIGLFGAWNERLDGTGTEVKVSAAYGQKNTTITRQVVGTSEAGSGSSQLNSQGAQVMAKYGFAVTDKATVSPYVGVRYTQNNMGGYTEGASSTVTAPLTYSALNTNATTALAGLGASYKVIPAVTTFASAGVETDTNTSNGSYSATGVTGLTPVNFNPNPVRTRPTAMVGAYYDIVKNQRLGVTGIYRQEAYQAVATTTLMATYTIGL